METIIAANGVTRGFKAGGNTFWALKDINVEIEKGKLTLLRGRSGSGKTTLMNILGALDYPTNGQVIFGGKDIAKISNKKRDKIRRKNMGFVFQSVALVSMMSAYENVEFGLRIAGYPMRERRKRAEECLKMVGLQGRMYHMPQEMSGGEQQRVAIARAIAHKPQVIFADEPTAELDSNMGLQIMKIFKELVDKEGITIVMTTHDPSIMDIADHVYVMEDGVVTSER